MRIHGHDRLRVGHAILASFQNCSSLGRASGSDSIRLGIAVSLKLRSFFQFVPEGRSALDVFPIGASFVILFIGPNWANNWKQTVSHSFHILGAL
jgi:hypothetical protein